SRTHFAPSFSLSTSPSTRLLYTLSLHDALPIFATICSLLALRGDERALDVGTGSGYQAAVLAELADEVVTVERIPSLAEAARSRDRKSTRLNSSHEWISYAVFCLKKKNRN